MSSRHLPKKDPVQETLWTHEGRIPWLHCLLCEDTMNQEQQTRIEAAVFRRLRDHLQANTDVQNIDLMLLADFCRNCLGKWYAAAAEAEGVDLDPMDARDIVYGMPYSEWKAKHQLPADPEKLAALKAKSAQG